MMMINNDNDDDDCGDDDAKTCRTRGRVRLKGRGCRRRH